MGGNCLGYRERCVTLMIVGQKLPDLQFNNQKVEAAYRKELVYGEDHENRADPHIKRVI